MGLVPRENVYEENILPVDPEFNKAYDVQVNYKGETYYGSSYVDMNAAYRDLMDDVPDELMGNVIKRLDTVY